MSLHSSKGYFQEIRNSLLPHFSKEQASTLAFILLEEYENIPKTAILADRLIEKHSAQKIFDAVALLITKKPIQYVLGYTHFCDLKINVNKQVLIPRPETEELVYRILADFKNSTPSTFLDIGTGSGCIPIAIKKNLASSKVFAIDISKNALEIAAKNAHYNHVEIGFFERDIFHHSAIDLIPDEIDVIISNPPYVLESEKVDMDENVLNFEPHLALFVPNNDPLKYYKAILDYAKVKLAHNGTLYFEINALQSLQLQQLIHSLKFWSIEIMKDFNNKDRFAIIRRF